MKATTFVLRQHQRIDEMIRVLERERHLRVPMLTDLVEEVLSFLALEEDLFYPRVAARVNDDEADVVREVHDRISEEHTALLDLLSAETDAEFADRMKRLARVLSAHFDSDRVIIPVAERALGERELEEMGTRMARFYRESVGAARDRESNVPTIH